MPHPMYRVKRFTIVGPYTVDVGFTDGPEQRINFRPVLEGAVFGPLQDLTLFNAVSARLATRRERYGYEDHTKKRS